MKKKSKKQAQQSIMLATKQDITFLMGEMTRMYEEIANVHVTVKKLYAANERWKNEILTETKRHFDVVAENIHYDCIGVTKDQIAGHEQRIVKLERHAGLAV